MQAWTKLLLACILGALLLARTECRQQRGSSALVPPGAYCGPCDIRSCPTLQADSCSGSVVKDECNCCPVCQVSLTSEPAAEDLNFTASKNESGCASVQCPRMQICMHNIQGLPLCRCPSVYHCRQFPRKPLCGRDGHTYKHRCYLQMAECSQGKKIRVAYMGRCRKEDEAVDEGERKEERKKIRKQRRNRKRKKQQRKKNKGTHVTTIDEDQTPDFATYPSLPPLEYKPPQENSHTKLNAKERRKQRRKDRQKRRKLRKKEKRQRQRRRIRRSCVGESQS